MGYGVSRLKGLAFWRLRLAREVVSNGFLSLGPFLSVPVLMPEMLFFFPQWNPMRAPESRIHLLPHL